MKISEYSKPALFTAIYYFIFGFIWIGLSDHLVHQIAANHDIEDQLQTYKGWFFILITTALIFYVVKQQVKRGVDLKNKLLTSERRYKKIVKITHDLIWNTDSNGVITFVNNASNDIFGLAPEEMIGRKFSDFVEKEQYLRNIEKMAKKFSEGYKSVEFETTIKHAEGNKTYLRDTVTAVFDKNKRVKLLEGASVNITDFKIYEQQLIESKQRLELAMSGGEIGLWDYWFDDQKLIINKHWNAVLGKEIKNGIIDIPTMTQLVHPEDMAALNRAFGKPSSGDEKFVEAEFRIKHTDGTYRWITSKGKVAEWENDKPLRMMGAIIDSTEKKNLEIELKNLVKLYSSFIRYSSEGIYLFEMNQPMPVSLPVEEQIRQLYHNGYIRTCNDAFAKMYGYNTGEEMTGIDQTTLHGGDDDPKNIELLRRFINSGYRIMNDVTKETDKDGKELFISNNVVGIIENEKLIRTWGIQSDITSQVLAQQKIEESENKYRLLFETNPVPMVILDATVFHFYDVNREFEKLAGYQKEELLAMNIRHLWPEVSELSNENLQHLMRKEWNTKTEMVLQSKPNKTIPCQVKLDKINIHGITAFIIAINDMTEVRNAEKMVIQSLIEGADNERSRVAKELHDGLGQNLTAASLNLNAIESGIKKLGGKNAEKFDNGLKFLKNAIEESRNIAHNLMPKAIEDFGIILSLKSLFNQIEKTTGLKINFYENIGQEVRLDIQIELNIYRITQEAVNNVIKHAGASEIFVQLMVHPSEIIYTFEDNGKGFDKLILNTGKNGIGIKSMYNRAKAMSGYCDVESEINKGTTITIVIPIEK